MKKNNCSVYLEEECNYICNFYKYKSELIQELIDEKSAYITISDVLDNEKFIDNVKNYKIFISTFRDDDYSKYGTNVKTIKNEELGQWAKENKNILPERIKNYIQISKNI